MWNDGKSNFGKKFYSKGPLGGEMHSTECHYLFEIFSTLKYKNKSLCMTTISSHCFWGPGLLSGWDDASVPDHLRTRAARPFGVFCETELFSRTAAGSWEEMTGDWGLVKCNNASKLGLLSHDPPGGGRFLNMEIKLCILSCCSKYKDKISLTINCMWGNLLNVLWEPNRSFCTGLFYP